MKRRSRARSISLRSIAAEGWGCGRAAEAPLPVPLAPAADTLARARRDGWRAWEVLGMHLDAAAALGRLGRRLQAAVRYETAVARRSGHLCSCASSAERRARTSGAGRGKGRRERVRSRPPASTEQCRRASSMRAMSGLCPESGNGSNPYAPSTPPPCRLLTARCPCPAMPPFTQAAHNDRHAPSTSEL